MFCAYTRPRYQVSVYRTIGPLVFFSFVVFQCTAKHQPMSSPKDIAIVLVREKRILTICSLCTYIFLMSPRNRTYTASGQIDL